MALPTLTPGKLTRLWLHYQRVSNETSGSELRLSVNVLEGAVYEGGRVLQLGEDNSRVDLKGYLTGDQNLETRLYDCLNTTAARYYAEAPDASVAGNPVYGGLIQANEVKITNPTVGLVAIDGTLMLKTPDSRYVSGNPYRGRMMYNAHVVFPAGTIAAVNGPAINMGSSIGGMVYGHYSLLWVPAGNSITIKVQHSADGATGWTDFAGATATLTAETNGPGLGVAVIAWQETTTDAYWRVVLTPAGLAGKTLDLMTWGQYNDGRGLRNFQESGYELVEDSLMEWVLDDNGEPLDNA